MVIQQPLLNIVFNGRLHSLRYWNKKKRITDTNFKNTVVNRKTKKQQQM